MPARTCAVLGFLLSLAGAAQAAGREAEIEADWLSQVPSKSGRPASPASGGVTAKQDAIGACDGVKDGRWGFHTANEAQPWWQVDLGRAQELQRVLIFNRCDATAGRTARLILLLSDDGSQWRRAYQHDGSVFHGKTDGKPLAISLAGERARFVRVQLPGHDYLHLDEVEVYGPAEGRGNLALGKTADQSSTSEWSSAKGPVLATQSTFPVAAATSSLRRGRLLAADLAAAGVDVRPCLAELDGVEAELEALPAASPGEAVRALYLRCRRAVRKLAFANPLLDFDSLLFAKRAPGSYSHMSDQYYGWWSRPGGGVCILDGLKSDTPRVRCLTADMPAGSFLRPELSYDATKVLFAYCKHYPHVAGLGDKAHKANVPEDAFYHLYEMNVDGTGRRQLTRGRYDDFDARYLPSGQIVFISTRRGQFVQCGTSARQTLQADLPDSYVRCGGGNSRPVAVYTLHVMGADGGGLRAISAFENFEWTPSVANDGRILYARWDYVDRTNNPYMSLWSTNPDGSNPQGVYGNFTRPPQCIFEARSVPNSNKILFTASAHHAITGGSIVLLDCDVAQDGPEPLTRLTGEVCFPEIEGWPRTYYANPYPLSERHYLAAWSSHPIRPEGGANPVNSLGLYLCDAFGNLEPIYRDPNISSMYPIPLRPRPRPPVFTRSDGAEESREGRMLLVNVHHGLTGIEAGTVKSLRIIAVPAKTQPQMNQPALGATNEDPGKCVLGTVPVEADGSAHFRLPAGVNVFFQALDSRGRAVQTMRTVTYVQPDQTLSCVGCHEPRNTAPPMVRPRAALREASRIRPGPEGSWPLRFDRLVQPVLDRHCARCHRPGPEGKARAVAKLDLTPGRSYEALSSYGGGRSLRSLVRSRHDVGRSLAGQCEAASSPVLDVLCRPAGHHDVRLGADDLDRLITWMDAYGQTLGSFSADQEARLVQLRKEWADLLSEGR